jgi:hypothetical protein
VLVLQLKKPQDVFKDEANQSKHEEVGFSPVLEEWEDIRAESPERLDDPRHCDDVAHVVEFPLSKLEVVRLDQDVEEITDAEQSLTERNQSDNREVNPVL